MQQSGYGTIVVRPHPLQFIVNELLLMLLTAAGFMAAGLEGSEYSDLMFMLSSFCLILLTYKLIYLRKMEFRISGEQLISEHGVFTRNSDYIELYRVVDFREHRSFFQQVFGLKTVSIYSGDRTTPRLDIIGVNDRMELVAYIRERVEYNKRRKGIYEITNR